MWNLIAVAVCGSTLFLLIRRLGAFSDPVTRFVLLAVWARYAVSAFPAYTHPSVIAGFSLNSLLSILVVGTGLLLLPLRMYRLPFLLPFALILFHVVISGIVNAEFFGLLSDATRWLYFIVITLALYRAFEIYGIDAILRCLLISLSTMAILQAISVVIGKTDGAEFDGSISYTGGYGHEGDFSLILFTILCASAFVCWKRGATALGIAALCVVGIVLANYRTTIIAAFPVIMVIVTVTTVRWTPPLLRPIILVGALLAIAGGCWLFWIFMPPRLYDIVLALNSVGELIKPPDLYTWAERDIFNARMYIWSQYIYEWLQGSTFEKFLGFGPEAWQGVFELNAHSTFVSYLYEYGLVGLGLLFLMLSVQTAVAMAGADRFVAAKLTACIIGFGLLNIAHVPLWSIEGLIAFALLCALSWAYALGKGPEPVVEPAGLKRRGIGARWRADSKGPLGTRRASAKGKRAVEAAFCREDRSATLGR